MIKLNYLMKLSISFFFVFGTLTLKSQKSVNYVTETYQDKNGFTYQTVTNDPLAARVYILKNGLTVYLSDYKDAPRIQTYVAVRAGSKNDPADATGLAHYLEHILFKGTSKIGATDWSREQAELLKIESLFETYRRTNDEKRRTVIYKQIDSISLVAASFAIANEYDKLLSQIGATGTNAYTFVEQTVYVNDIPSNQIEKWAMIEGERFSEVVPRLFHTELEAVYEEKNKGLDNDRRKVWEATMAALFEKHTYGTQTTIGTIEHLKNPSIAAIKKYFNTYYVPNNMAVCMSGDLDFDETILLINKYFGNLKEKEVPVFIPAVEAPINGPKIVEIKGPDAENITIAFRANGNYTQKRENGVYKTTYETDPYFLQLLSMVLFNSEAGLIDLNLNQQQKVLQAYAYALSLNDYSVFTMAARPKQGQTLEELKSLLLSQLDLVKKGAFDDWLLQAVINNYKIKKLKEYESNRSRADAFVDAFISHKSWEYNLSEINILESISKEQLVEFANRVCSDNYVVIYKRIGTDTTIQKVPKPKISAVSVNRDAQSAFYTSLGKVQSEEIAPVFLDYDKDILKLKTKKKLSINYVENKENDLFQLYYLWDIGREHDPIYALAVSYMDYLGTDQYSAEELKKEFYKLGCSYSITMTQDNIVVSLSGLKQNFEKAYLLLEQWMRKPKVEELYLKELIEKILKVRNDNKLSKDVILKHALLNYAKYGKLSPFTNILSEEKLRTIKAGELVKIISNLNLLEHRVLYYGPHQSDYLENYIASVHKVKSKRKPVPFDLSYNFKDINTNEVYWVNYDMVQAEIMFISRGDYFNTELFPTASLFNEYFGGSMGSLVFQEMRESKALAYAVKSYYQVATKPGQPDFMISYIGTQADKTHESINGLNELLENMPESPLLFENAKASILETMRSQRITKAAILMDYEKAKRMGVEYDLRKQAYEAIKQMDFNSIKKFQAEFVKGKPKIILAVGSREKIEFGSLNKYGKVKELNLIEIFGY